MRGRMGVAPGWSGYDARMSQDSSERETPEVGLIADDELPEDLRPSDDNPLAQDPAETTADNDHDAKSSGEQKVEGMPDMDDPGPA